MYVHCTSTVRTVTELCTLQEMCELELSMYKNCKNCTKYLQEL
jgi:hypothetical protein